MNSTQIQAYVTKYLEATNCHIIEKSPAHLTVKLSPEADKALTNRHYYWGFVERTGAEAQTMTFTFVFDPAKHLVNKQLEDARKAQPAAASAPEQASANDTSILGRYFGTVPAASPLGRVPQDELTFGSGRLQQIFAASLAKGKYVQLFEEAGKASRQTLPVNAGYHPWFMVNYKVELACDMKRDELHSLGISLISGTIIDHCYERMLDRKWSPRMPSAIPIARSVFTIQRALAQLEQHMERKLLAYDHSWADDAHNRLLEEWDRINPYYSELATTTDDEQKQEYDQQFIRRKAEIEWQYKPRVQVSVINCGLFHINPQKPLAVDQ